MSLFKGSRNVRQTGSGTYMQPGNYTVQIKRVETRRSTDPRKKGADVMICEFKITKSDNPTHKPGSTGSWVAVFDEFDKTRANVNALFGAALDDFFPTVEITPGSPEAMELIEYFECAVLEGHLDEGAAAKKALEEMGVEDPASKILDKIVDLECFIIKTKKGEDFTRYCWTPGRSAVVS